MKRIIIVSLISGFISGCVTYGTDVYDAEGYYKHSFNKAGYRTTNRITSKWSFWRFLDFLRDMDI
jgi:hypothetical protein